MWMPEHGIGHNVLMGFGYLIGAFLLGSIWYFAIKFWFQRHESEDGWPRKTSSR